MEKLAYSVSEVCSAAGVSRSFLYLEWKRGRGPLRIKMGRRTLVSREALAAWVCNPGNLSAPTVPELGRNNG